MAYFFQLLANAVPLAALYAVLAFGYSIAFALMRRADITYGAIFAFSGHVYLVFAQIGWDRLWLVLWAALALGAATALASGVGTGFLVGRIVMRPLVKTSPNALIVASLGIVLVLMETTRLAANSRELWLSPFLNSPIVLWQADNFPVTLTTIQLVNIVAMLTMIATGQIVLTSSPWGRWWRAVSEDPLAAQLCGVNADKVFVMSYAAAAMFASGAGVLATSHYGTIDFGAGLSFGVKVVLIAAAGGHSNPLSAAAGAAVIGFIETIWSGYGPVLWRDVVVVSLLVFFLVSSRRQHTVP